MRRHIVRSIAVVSVASFLLAGPVAAKVPYFSIDVTPFEPVEGEVVVIVLRLWDDAMHTRPATWWPEPTVEDLVELRGPTGRIELTLLQVDDATYRAEARLAAGTWRIIPFPRYGDEMVAGAGYPVPMAVTVGSGFPTSAIAAGGVLGLMTVGLVAGGAVRRRMLRRRAEAH